MNETKEIVKKENHLILDKFSTKIEEETEKSDNSSGNTSVTGANKYCIDEKPTSWFFSVKNEVKKQEKSLQCLFAKQCIFSP